MFTEVVQFAPSAMTDKGSAACSAHTCWCLAHRPASSSSSTALTCRIVLDGKPRARSFSSISSRGAVACARSGIATGALESLAMATKISSRRERNAARMERPTSRGLGVSECAGWLHAGGDLLGQVLAERVGFEPTKRY